ncbi:MULTISPECIES: BON domain-containing protein [unclassified Cupriavidus]|uniref:BON domain-containing protein n=1 Tax=Cupriavidus sp. H19C3 TaxID=3241603 RepID=UPI003BF85A0E
MRTDDELKTLVRDELNWDPRITSTAIDTEVRHGIVTLSGHVGSYAEKLAAERAAERVSGVKGVVIKMEVREDTAQKDEQIALAARAALQWYVHVPADALQLEVENGRVTLRGDVQWGFQRRSAESVVSHLRGVRGVHNEIRVIPKLVPEEVEGKIESALRRHAQREAHHISVKASAGVVTLEGTVDSLAERRAAVGAAWSAPGVSEVINRLRVG